MVFLRKSNRPLPLSYMNPNDPSFEISLWPFGAQNSYLCQNKLLILISKRFLLKSNKIKQRLMAVFVYLVHLKIYFARKCCLSLLIIISIQLSIVHVLIKGELDHKRFFGKILNFIVVKLYLRWNFTYLFYLELRYLIT